MAELIDNAPVKDELVTHDGVVYFPKEMMPPEPDETLEYTARLGIKGNAASSYLLKSKRLNLKLKIKKPNTNKTSIAPTLVPGGGSNRNSIQLQSLKTNTNMMTLNMVGLKQNEMQGGSSFQTQRINLGIPDTPLHLEQNIIEDGNQPMQVIEMNSDYVEQAMLRYPQRNSLPSAVTH